MGVRSHEILEHVKTRKSDLVVAGITGSSESTSGAGSLAVRLVHKAGTKVLLVRADHPNPSQKIIACIDFSETSREVATQAHRVAVQDGATVDFLHVWREPGLSLRYAFAPFGASVPEAASTISDEYLQALNATLCEFVREASVDIESCTHLVKASNYGNGNAEHVVRLVPCLILVIRGDRVFVNDDASDQTTFFGTSFHF